MKMTEKKPEDSGINLEITVLVKDVYGQKKFYPECNKARVFASIAGTRTLTEAVLRKIMELGYKVNVVTPEVVIQEELK